MTAISGIGRATAAMKAVYGSFDQLSDDEIARWTPPEHPGAGGHRGRYLWTDAFGVVNFITMARESSSPKYLELAKRLVQAVQDILGRTRDGAARLDGATDDEPLKGGLRIGKASATGDDCDGQYHHYLTIWMFALNRLSIAAKDPKYNDLAIQLAKAIHPQFLVKKLTGGTKMVWKISIDMKDVLVASEGHLDATTGFVIFRLLQETAVNQGRQAKLLQQEIDDYDKIMGRKENIRPSGDLLDLGMGLWIAHIYPDEKWAAEFKTKALSLAQMLLADDSPMLMRDAAKRLAFREFGACLGVRCFAGEGAVDTVLEPQVEALLNFWEGYVADDLEEDIRPISQVMYASVRKMGGKQRAMNYCQRNSADKNSAFKISYLQ